jgi:hypothetical protein
LDNRPKSIIMERLECEKNKADQLIGKKHQEAREAAELAAARTLGVESACKLLREAGFDFGNRYNEPPNKVPGSYQPGTIGAMALDKELKLRNKRIEEVQKKVGQAFEDARLEVALGKDLDAARKLIDSFSGRLGKILATI